MTGEEQSYDYIIRNNLRGALLHEDAARRLAASRGISDEQLAAMTEEERRDELPSCSETLS